MQRWNMTIVLDPIDRKIASKRKSWFASIYHDHNADYRQYTPQLFIEFKNWLLHEIERPDKLLISLAVGGRYIHSKSYTSNI